MPNSYFQFKQFIIHQDQCAMKVCTDACIFGAWFAEKIPAWSSVLDIGSGTGLLTLMLAQKHKGELVGIELDLLAYRQCKDNINLSPWRDRIRAFPGDVRNFSFTGKFDFIISNPPFYEGDLPASTEAKNLARHSHELNLAELLTAIDSNLSQSGTFGILLPYHRLPQAETLAASLGFHLIEKLLIRQSPRHHFFRGILHFSRRRDGIIPENELTIQNTTGNYTGEFVELLRDYYLKL